MKKFFMLVLALSLGLAAASAFAQSSTTGSIEGTVTDTNGAAVPNVTVAVTSPNLIVPQTAQTDSQGHFYIANLPPGKYSVKVAAAGGFAEYTQGDVSVNLS